MVLYVKAHEIIKDQISDYPEKGMLVVQALEGSTLTDLLKTLNLSNEEVGLVVINGTFFNKDTVLNAGDLVELFPPIFGG
jgi:sulfur carrier protein ThiS